MTEQDAAEVILRGLTLVRCPNWRDQVPMRENGSPSSMHHCSLCEGKEIIIEPAYVQACGVLGVRLDEPAIMRAVRRVFKNLKLAEAYGALYPQPFKS